MILLSALGPYIAVGTRLEHFIIYPLFIGLMIAFAFGLRLNKNIFILGLPLFCSVIVMIVLDGYSFEGERQVTFPASLDNILQPALLVFIYACLLEKSSIEAVLKSGVTVLVWSAVCMACIALLSFFFDISEFTQYFVSRDGMVEESVWYAATNVGRYSGIFNQPLEAGSFYSTALIGLVMLNRLFEYKGLKYIIAMGFICIGGLLSLSKSFVVLGVIISTVLFLSFGHRRWYIYLLALLSLVLGFFFIAYFFSNNAYRDSFVSLYQNDGFLALVTAGRFGSEDTEVQRLFTLFFQDGFFSGFGLGAQATLDNGFLEYAYQGGMLALFLYCLFFVIGLTYSISNFDIGYSRVVFALLIYGLLASVGGPVLTANRANIGYIFLLCGSIAATGFSKTIRVNQLKCLKVY